MRIERTESTRTKRHWRCRPAIAVRYLPLVGLGFLSGAPLAWILLVSLRNRRDVYSSTGLASIDLSAYGRVLTNLDILQHLANSAIVCALVLGIVIAVAPCGAYAFAKLKFPARDLIFYAYLVALMIPGHAILIPMFGFLRALGLLNSLVGLALSLVGGSVALSVFVLRAFFRTMPGELGDAARIDGCGEVGVFWRIYLPLARPGIAAVVILQFVATWNEFMFSSTFVTDSAMRTIQPAVFQSAGRYATDYPALSAGLVLALIPVLVTYWSLQRQFETGLRAGALVG